MLVEREMIITKKQNLSILYFIYFKVFYGCIFTVFAREFKYIKSADPAFTPVIGELFIVCNVIVMSPDEGSTPPGTLYDVSVPGIVCVTYAFVVSPTERYISGGMFPGYVQEIPNPAAALWNVPSAGAVIEKSSVAVIVQVAAPSEHDMCRPTCMPGVNTVPE